MGTSRRDVRARLGRPSFEKERGYWANTTVDRFDDVVPQWLTISYLYDTGTLRVRQVEASFEGFQKPDFALRPDRSSALLLTRLPPFSLRETETHGGSLPAAKASAGAVSSPG